MRDLSSFKDATFCPLRTPPVEREETLLFALSDFAKLQFCTAFNMTQCESNDDKMIEFESNSLSFNVAFS